MCHCGSARLCDNNESAVASMATVCVVIASPVSVSCVVSVVEVGPVLCCVVKMASVSGIRRRCVNKPDSFCYVCGCYIMKGQSRPITALVKRLYYAYFKVKLGDMDKVWAPHVICKTCMENLRQWSQGKRKALPFGIGMVWREPQDHISDCYFCLCRVSGFNKKNKDSIVYPNLKSARRPVPHGPLIPIPSPPTSLPASDASSESDDEQVDTDFSLHTEEVSPQQFNQSELSNLIRDLGLTKEKSELLGSRLKEKNLLAAGTTFSWYRHRDKEFRKYFKKEEDLTYCCDIPGLIEQLGTGYKTEDWRLFVDSSKRSLKAVLLHNGNRLPSIPLAHSVLLKENYVTMQTILDKIKYHEHRWYVCSDLKVCGILLGQQAGYTKFPCHICEWDSRARDKHWSTSTWPKRQALTPGVKNVTNAALVDPQKVILPPLHIKLGIMKQFVKALDKGRPCFQYIASKFTQLSDAKVKEGVFDGPQIKKLLKDQNFEQTMNAVELAAWISMRDVMTKFLGNVKDEQYETIVKTMLDHMKELGCRMSLKLHFLHSHLDQFPENLGAVSEEMGERFHQDIKEAERRYQGRWDVPMMADYCWCLKRDGEHGAVRRWAAKRSFQGDI